MNQYLPDSAFVHPMGFSLGPPTSSFNKTSRSRCPSIFIANHQKCYVVAVRAADSTSISKIPGASDSKEPSCTSAFDFESAQFADAVSGEWFGYQVTFSAKTGAAQNIEVNILFQTKTSRQGRTLS